MPAVILVPSCSEYVYQVVLGDIRCKAARREREALSHYQEGESID